MSKIALFVVTHRAPADGVKNAKSSFHSLVYHGGGVPETVAEAICDGSKKTCHHKNFL